MGKKLAFLVFLLGLMAFFSYPPAGIVILVIAGILWSRSGKKPKEEEFTDIEGRRIVIYY